MGVRTLETSREQGRRGQAAVGRLPENEMVPGPSPEPADPDARGSPCPSGQRISLPKPRARRPGCQRLTVPDWSKDLTLATLCCTVE